MSVITGDELTPKQQMFVDAYLVSFNATDAARKAGYKGNDNTLRQVGFENLTKPNIISQLTKRYRYIAAKSEKRLINTYDEFLENLEFTRKLRVAVANLIVDANDPATFSLQGKLPELDAALKVIDRIESHLDKFAKMGGDYTKDKENPTTITDTIWLYKAIIDAQFPTPDLQRAFIDKLIHKSGIPETELVKGVQQIEALQ